MNLVGWREQNRLRRVLNIVLKNLMSQNTIVLQIRGEFWVRNNRDEDEYSKLLKEGGDKKGVL